MRKYPLFGGYEADVTVNNESAAASALMYTACSKLNHIFKANNFAYRFIRAPSKPLHDSQVSIILANSPTHIPCHAMVG